MKTVLHALTTIAATALVATAPAHAAPNDTTRIAVRYADLDLATAEGRAKLEERIQSAAREACGMTGAQTTGSRLPSRSRLACFEAATSQIGESIARAVARQDAKG